MDNTLLSTYIFLLEGRIIEDVEDTGHLGHDGTETQRIANGRQPWGDLETRFRGIQHSYSLLNTSVYGIESGTLF